jgi:hypothetical protein
LYFDNAYRAWIEIKPIENVFRKVHKNNDIKQDIYHTLQPGPYYSNISEIDIAMEGLSAIHIDLQESIKNGMQFWKEFNSIEKIRKNVHQLHPETELFQFLRAPCLVRKLGILALTNGLECDNCRRYIIHLYDGN